MQWLIPHDLIFLTSKSKEDIYFKSYLISLHHLTSDFLLFSTFLSLGFCEPSFLLTSESNFSFDITCPPPQPQPLRCLLVLRARVCLPLLSFCTVMTVTFWSQLLLTFQWFLNLGLKLNSTLHCEVKLVNWMYGQCLFSSYHFWFVCLRISLGIHSNPSATPSCGEDGSCDKENIPVLARWVEMGEGLGLLRDLPNEAGKPVYLNQIMSLGEIRGSQRTWRPLLSKLPT